MARQFEWEHSNLQIAYPFEPHNDLFGAVGFADALILDASNTQKRVKLEELVIDPPNSTIDIMYDDNTQFFDGAYESDVVSFGKWVVIKFYSNVERKSVTLMIHEDEVGSYPFVFSLSHATFVARVTEKTAKRIDSITVKDNVTDITHVFSEPCKLVAGNNLDIPLITTTAPIQRVGSVLRFNVVPGAGLGRDDGDCNPENVLRTLSGVGPDATGNVSLVPIGCYRETRPNTWYTPNNIRISPYTIQLFNDCYPCCECEDYSNVYKGMDRLYLRGRNIGLRLANVIGTVSPSPTEDGTGYKGLREEMEEERQAREIPRMDIFLRPSAGFILGVELLFKNNRPGVTLDMSEVEIEFTMENPEGSEFDAKQGELIPDSIYVLNSSRGVKWERRVVSEVFVDFVNFLNPVELSFTYTPESEPDPGPELLDGTQYLSVFFEVYFGNVENVGVAVDDEVGVGLDSPTFLPVEKLVKYETLIPPFDGNIVLPGEEAE